MNEANATLVVVVTGMSGAGKSTALNALEDLSFYCVDNLPTPLILQTLSVCRSEGLTRVALGIDVRVGSFLQETKAVFKELAASPEWNFRILFLDASDEALLRRYSETRRPHPLSTTETEEGTAVAVLDGITAERRSLSALRANAGNVVDTTQLSVHDLRRHVVDLLGPASGSTTRMRTRILSFGFKYGMPVDADLVLDVRFLDNPYFVPELRERPGTDPDVAGYIFSKDATQEFCKRALELLRFTLPQYEKEGKSYLTIAVGCTGGRHRSVALSEYFAKILGEELELPIDVRHRDVMRKKLRKAAEAALGAASEGSPSGDRTSEVDVIGGGVRGKGQP